MNSKTGFTKFVLLASTVALLAGCDISGTLKMKKSTSLVDKKGHTVALAAGQSYKTEIGKDGDKLKFNIKVDGKQREVRFTPPPGTKIPKQEGDLFIPAGRSGQPVDFAGSVRTTVTEGRDQRRTHSCTVWVRDWVCDGRYGGCRYIDRPVNGWQDVVYHDETTTTTAVALLLTAGTKNELGRFDGRDVTTEQIVTWEGRCDGWR